MKFFLDTANVDEIRKGMDWGCVDGVTTNPSLVAKEGRNFEEVVKEIVSLVPGPVSAEVVSVTAPEMLEEARRLAAWAPNIVVKIPLIPEGIKAVKVLSAEGIHTNVTLCFSPNQAILAAKAGASYISPFVGRLDDAGNEGMKIVAEIKQIYENYGFETEIIVASVRSPMTVTEAALIGADIATVPFKVMEQMFKHPLTDRGLESFLADWKKFQESL
ncbi:MAG: fructose-6-phosphate aldolase [Armatimonadetes bacterium]|nr:fructose-6-phosphate aldolase [Armatimonadota bacterium]